MAKSPYFLFNRVRCFRVTMPPPPRSALHSTPAVKECQMSNFRGVSRSSLFSVTNGNSKGWHMQRCTTCSGRSRHSDKEGREEGGGAVSHHGKPATTWSQKNCFRFSQFGPKIFGPSPRSTTDMAAVWIKVACVAIGIVSMCKVLAEELRRGDWVELWNFLTSTRIITKMVASSPKL